MTGTPSGSIYSHIGHCPTTGKRQFTTKKAARVIRRRMGTAGLSVFRCDACGDWHIGHHGDLTRDQHRARRSA